MLTSAGSNLSLIDTPTNIFVATLETMQNDEAAPSPKITMLNRRTIIFLAVSIKDAVGQSVKKIVTPPYEYISINPSRGKL